MRGKWSVAFFLLGMGVVQGQPVLTETSEYPASRPGPGAAQSGFGCFHLASGVITPGDVDWVQITLPRSTTQMVVDVDFPAANGGGSALLASIVGGGTAFNIRDTNNGRDSLCGLHATSVPVGSTSDSTANLNATARNIVVNVGITGAADTGFAGAHFESFPYDVWVYAATVSCTSDVDCNDNVACTDDACDTATGDCFNDADDGLCADGRFCNGAESCDGVRGCRPGRTPDCDDGVDCTFDFCHATRDECTSVPDDDFCSNDTFCDGEEWCDVELDCQLGDPETCDDDVACTVDACDLETDACVSTPDDSRCDDGWYCNGAETCDEVAGCEAGAPPDCGDGVACTIDDCDPLLDDCVNLPDDGLCDDEEFCNGTEWCDVRSDCQPGDLATCDDGVGCTVDACDLSTDACADTADDSLCDDGRFCNGVETCDAVADCQAGAPPDCDDGVGCTVDACGLSTDACAHTADDSPCDDGRFCNGVETCDAAADCQAGAPPDCDDGVACTVDSCNAALDNCVNVPDDARCDNGMFCDGAEVCDPVNGCGTGDEGCPGQFCRESEPFCVDCLSDADCDDEGFCNGAETCDPTGTCVEGAPPCPPDMTCNPETRECEGEGQFTLDIKPRACPNTVPAKGDGNLAMAIVGGPGADVKNINRASLRLSRADGVGRPLKPKQDKKLRDVTAPFEGEPCACHTSDGDGFEDMVVQFDLKAVIKELALDKAPPKTPVLLQLSGKLLDGTEFQVWDCLAVTRAGRDGSGGK